MNKTQDSQGNAPIQTIRDGMLKAQIWENQSDNGPFHSVTVAKTYEDSNGKLRDTHSFSGSDMLRVSELARQAHHRVLDLRRDLQHDQSHQQDQGRADRQAQYQDRRSNGGGGGRSHVPRRDGGQLADTFRPTL